MFKEITHLSSYFLIVNSDSNIIKIRVAIKTTRTESKIETEQVKSFTSAHNPTFEKGNCSEVEKAFEPFV